MQTEDPFVIREVDALEALYAAPRQAALLKVSDHIHPLYQPFIEAAPFAVLATRGPEGPDVSPRGDAPGFVRVADRHTLLLPDRRGNNRIDSLRNLLWDPEVSLLFLIPGIGETLRVSGRAEITTDPALCESLAEAGRAPVSVLRIRVRQVFIQCSRAVVRAKLWDPGAQMPRSALPSAGAVLEALSQSEIDGAAYDAELPQRVKDTLY